MVDVPMSEILAMSLHQYVRAYKGYAIDFWQNLTPMQYGMILIGVMVAGYLMMRSAR